MQFKLINKHKKLTIGICIMCSILMNTIFTVFFSTKRTDMGEIIANDIDIANENTETGLVTFKIKNHSEKWFSYNIFNTIKFSNFNDASFAYMEYDNTSFILNEADNNIYAKPYGITNETIKENLFNLKIIAGDKDLSYLCYDNLIENDNVYRCCISKSVCAKVNLNVDEAIGKTIKNEATNKILEIVSVVDDSCLLNDYNQSDCFVISQYLYFSPKFKGEKFVIKIKKSNYASNVTTIGSYLQNFYYNILYSGGYVTVECTNNDWIVKEIEKGEIYGEKRIYWVSIFFISCLYFFVGYFLSYSLNQKQNSKIMTNNRIIIYSFFAFFLITSLLNLILNHVTIFGLSLNTKSSSAIMGKLMFVLFWIIGITIYKLLHDFKNDETNNKENDNCEYYKVIL